jgi:hypothetical protein
MAVVHLHLGRPAGHPDDLVLPVVVEAPSAGLVGAEPADPHGVLVLAVVRVERRSRS